jgi:hypothetical protein
MEEDGMSRKKKGRKKVSFEAADEIRAMVAGGASLREVSERYGISIPYASLISRGLRKRRRTAHVAA